MIDYGICLSVFDDRIGPMLVFHEKMEEKVAIRIAFKSIISSGSTTYHEGHSIISVFETNSIAFVYFFTVPDKSYTRGNSRPFTISFVTTPDQQMDLYKDAGKLATFSKKLIAKIKTWIIQDKLQDDVLKSNILNEITIGLKPSLPKVEELPKGSAKYLSRVVTRNLGNAIYGLIMGLQVVVLGDRPEVELALSSLKMFAPHRELNIEIWTEGISKSDLVGTNVNNQQNYENTGAVLVYLDNGRVYGGRHSKFCDMLINSVKDLESQQASMVIQTRIQWLISKASAFAALHGDAATQEKMIDVLVNQTDKDSLYMIASLVEKTSPAAANLLRKEGIRKKMKGIL